MDFPGQYGIWYEKAFFGGPKNYMKSGLELLSFKSLHVGKQVFFVTEFGILGKNLPLYKESQWVWILERFLNKGI